MQPQANPATGNEASDSAPTRKAAIIPDFTGTPVPIGQLTERADWPQGALGSFVSIHGFDGVVVEIINQSIKVISADRTTQRFNSNRLRTLFAPHARPKPVPVEAVKEPAPELAGVPARSRSSLDEGRPAAPARVHITAPDFVAPLRPIRSYATQMDFPQCAYGKHVDIRGYSGVVVEIVDGSLKIQTQAGGIRSFNGAMLRKLYGAV